MFPLLNFFIFTNNFDIMLLVTHNGLLGQSLSVQRYKETELGVCGFVFTCFRKCFRTSFEVRKFKCFLNSFCLTNALKMKTKTKTENGENGFCEGDLNMN